MERQSTPGDASTVFCVLVDDKPAGTAFAISNRFVLTAFHNISTGDNQFAASIGLCSSLMNDKGVYVTTEVIPVDCVRHDEAEDWAILKLKDDSPSRFSAFAAVCLEDELPKAREQVGIRDFQVGNFTSKSENKLDVCSSGPVKVAGYENRVSPPPSPESPHPKRVKVVQELPVLVEDAVKVEGGRTIGSCGGPYFTRSGKVFAFHERSFNDTMDDDLMSVQSHHSISVGYVLCRLPNFMKWYNSMSPNS